MALFRLIWVKREAEYFCKNDWTVQISLKSLRNFVCTRNGRSDPADGIKLEPAPPFIRGPRVMNAWLATKPVTCRSHISERAMSTVFSTPEPRSIASGLSSLRSKWGWIVALGVIYLIAGILAFGSIYFATAVSILFVGAMMIVAGIAEIFNAFQFKSWGKFVLWLLLGALYVVAGFFVFENPLLAAVTLTLVIGIALVISGIVRLFLAFSMNAAAPWGLVALSGVITLLLGAIILARWPVSSLYVLGIFLSVDLIFAGVGWISMGLALRRSRA
jgi:uncharacterized membrane protein HdeD (DUF308 family)